MTHNRTLKNVFAIAALALGLSATAQAGADKTWAWNYQMNGVSAASGTQRPGSGKNKAELFLEKGVYTFRIRGNTAPTCFAAEVPAQVEETDKTLTITPEGRFANCEKIRFVINKDGSGGTVQNRIGKKGNFGWEDDENTKYDFTPL